MANASGERIDRAQGIPFIEQLAQMILGFARVQA
jgi:hypothetical protein